MTKKQHQEKKVENKEKKEKPKKYNTEIKKVDKLNKMDTFLYTYYGNKYLETRKYYDCFKIKPGTKYIAEPFCGIFGFTRVHYEQNPDANVKYLLNDLNPHLISNLKEMKKDLKAYTKKIETELKRLYEKHKTDETDRPLVVYFQQGRETDPLIYICDIILRNYQSVNFFHCRLSREDRQAKKYDEYYKDGHFMPRLENFKKKFETYKKFLKKCSFYNLPWDEFVEKINKKHDKVVYYMDPPYLLQESSEYFVKNKEYLDPTKITTDIIKYFKNKERKNDYIYHCNTLEMIDLLIGEFKKEKYSKVYQSRKLTTEISIYKTY